MDNETLFSSESRSEDMELADYDENNKERLNRSIKVNISEEETKNSTVESNFNENSNDQF